MLNILAPSKTMNDTPLDSDNTWTTPLFLKQAQTIVATLDRRDDIADFMNISPALADQVNTMYQRWGQTTKPSVFMYRGDVYKGFYADTLTQHDLLWSQQHVMIASGLYGLLRPMDQISRYRLEMRTGLSVGGYKNLYEYWGDTLARVADEHADGIICILSAEEYARPIRKFSSSRIVTPVFMDHKPNGTVGQVPIYSKMMRGVMARWIIDHRINDPAGLVGFDRFGYMYDANRSKPDAPVFVRAKMTPLVF